METSVPSLYFSDVCLFFQHPHSSFFFPPIAECLIMLADVQNKMEELTAQMVFIA